MNESHFQLQSGSPPLTNVLPYFSFWVSNTTLFNVRLLEFEIIFLILSFIASYDHKFVFLTQIITSWFVYVQHPVKNYFEVVHQAHLQAYDYFQPTTLILKDS